MVARLPLARECGAAWGKECEPCRQKGLGEPRDFGAHPMLGALKGSPVRAAPHENGATSWGAAERHGCEIPGKCVCAFVSSDPVPACKNVLISRHVIWGA